MSRDEHAPAPAPAATQSLRAFATHAEYCPRLVAPPTAYDAAPCYLLEGYRAAAPAVQTQLRRITNPEYDTIATRDVGKDVRVALQLGAPIALGAVRIFLISNSLLLMAANPVTLVLGAPALLLTGRKVLDDIRRALVVDPVIRSYVQLAQAAAQRGDLASAEQHLKDALAVDVDPQNPRNGDLYLQLGMVHMQAGQPRKALVALSKASVLFGEREALVQQQEAGKVKLSKRGWAELLAMACIDSFAKDDQGLDEWTDVAKDFGASAMVRFQRFADAKASGHLLGLFGVDERSATLNRSLLAKVRFFQAKLESRRALAAAGRGGRLSPALEEGRQLLLADGSLSDDEKATALLEQAQFYFQASRRQGASLEMLDTALHLVDEAAGLLRAVSPARAVYLRAEAVAFALQLLPVAVRQGVVIDPQRRADLVRALAAVRDEAGRAEGVDGAAVYGVWAEEQLFRLCDGADDRRAAAARGMEAARELGDPVAQLHAALRLAFLERTAEAAATVTEAATEMAAHADPVVAAFGARYLAESAPPDRADVRSLFAGAARRLLSAADHVRERRETLPFLVQGHAVLHGWRESSLILQVLGAWCLLRAGEAAALEALLARLEASAAAIDSPEAIAVVATLRAARVVREDPARAERLVREAVERIPAAQRDAFGAWANALGGPARASEIAEGSEPASPAPAPAASHGLAAFHRSRDRLLAAATQAAAILTEATRAEEAAALAEHAERLGQNRFNLAVVGEFSTGKSTFINALLGDRILPSAVRPTTAAVNRISHAPAASATVRFSDGRALTIPLAELGDYITEKKNPGNRRGVVGVDIGHPLPLLESGITVLDTPGLRSLFEGHSETTYATLPKCDAVVLLTSATMPFSASEKEFLEQLREQLGGKVFLVVNKIDQLTPAEGARVLEYVKASAGAVIPGILVFGVSAYWALAARRLASGKADAAAYADDPNTGGLTSTPELLDGSRFPAFEEALFGHLARHKGQLLLESAARGVATPLRELVRATTAELASLDTSLGQVREKARQLVSRAREQRQRIDGLLADAGARLAEVEASFLAHLREERGPLQEKLLARIDAVPDAQLQGLDLSADLNAHLQRWASGLVQEVTAQAGTVLQDLSEGLNAVSQELSRVYDRSFDTTVPEGFARITLDVVRLETNQGSMPAVFGGAAGVAMALFGPVAALAAFAGLSFFSARLAEQKAAAARGKLKGDLIEALGQATASIQSSVRERLTELKLGPLARLEQQAEAVVARHERNAESLVRERERAETDGAEAKATLKARLGRVESVLRDLPGER